MLFHRARDDCRGVQGLEFRARVGRITCVCMNVDDYPKSRPTIHESSHLHPWNYVKVMNSDDSRIRVYGLRFGIACML